MQVFDEDGNDITPQPLYPVRRSAAAVQCHKFSRFLNELSMGAASETSGDSICSIPFSRWALWITPSFMIPIITIPICLSCSLFFIHCKSTNWLNVAVLVGYFIFSTRASVHQGLSTYCILYLVVLQVTHFWDSFCSRILCLGTGEIAFGHEHNHNFFPIFLNPCCLEGQQEATCQYWHPPA